MNTVQVMASFLLFAGSLLWPLALAQNVTTESDPAAVTRSAFSVEMIMAKLQVLEYHILKTDLQMDERIAALSSSVDTLLGSVEQLSRTVRDTNATVSSVQLDAKQIAHNLSAIQWQLDDLQATQKLLLTGAQFEDYLAARGCNETNAPTVDDGKHDVNATSCRNVPSNQTGVYQIRPENPFKEPMSVLCDQEYDSGGWTVIQHRFDGSVNFYRGWQEYKGGFGNLGGEFWLGLDRIHQLTASRPHELVVLLEDFDGNRTYARYDRFAIGDEGQKYVLANIDGYSGTAGDSLGDWKGMKFTTLDADNDAWSNNCAVRYTGAWWYEACHRSNLNGLYLRGDTEEYATGMVWYTFRGYHHSLKTSRMMIRPKLS